MANQLNTPGKTNANNLISSGKINTTSSWSFSAADGNAILGDPPDWGKYSKWFLGYASSGNKETKGYYKYPIGKNGKIYRSAIIAIRQRAGQQKDTEIENAAGTLLNKIDAKKGIVEFTTKAGDVKALEVARDGVLGCSVKSVNDPANGTSEKFVIDILASTPDIDRQDDIVSTGAFKSSVDQFVKSGVILYQHDSKKPIGIPTDANIDSSGLHVTSEISETVPDIRKMIQEGILRQASIGFKVKDFDITEDPTGKILFTITDLELLEVSLVSVAANPYTSVTMKDFCKELPEYREELEEVNTKEENIETIVISSNEITDGDIVTEIDEDTVITLDNDKETKEDETIIVPNTDVVETEIATETVSIKLEDILEYISEIENKNVLNLIVSECNDQIKTKFIDETKQTIVKDTKQSDLLDQLLAIKENL